MVVGSQQEVIAEPDEDLSSPARRGCLCFRPSGRHQPTNQTSPARGTLRGIASYFKRSLSRRTDGLSLSPLSAEGSEAHESNGSPRGLMSHNTPTASAEHRGVEAGDGPAAQLDLPAPMSKSQHLQPLAAAASASLPSDFDVLSPGKLTGKDKATKNGAPVVDGSGPDSQEPTVHSLAPSPGQRHPHSSTVVRDNFIAGTMDSELPPVRKGRSGFFRTAISKTSNNLLEGASSPDGQQPSPGIPAHRSSFKPLPQGWAGAESFRRPGSGRPQSGRPGSGRAQSSRSRGPKYRRAMHNNAPGGSPGLQGALMLSAGATPVLAGGRPGSARPGSARPDQRLRASGASRKQLR